MNNFHLRRSVLAMAVLAATSLTSVDAQTVTTPPRTITSQQETTGNDSTFQGDVVPNAQTSTFQMSVTAPAPPPPPAPTCAASSSSKTLSQTITPTVSQAAVCPAGYLTTSYASTFTQYATETENQVATQTTTTTCPAGIYGAPSTSTSTGGWTTTSSSLGAWSPTAASACTARTAYQLPINGQAFLDNGTATYVGGFDHAYGEVLVTVSNGSYSITYPEGAGTFNPKTYQAPVPVTGTWLPPGRVASDFTVTLSISSTQVTEQPIRVTYPSIGAYQPTLVTFTNSPPNPTHKGFSGIGVSTPTVSANGAGTVGVDVGGGELYRNTTGPDPTTGGATGVYTTATVTITITDNRNGESSSTSFEIGAGL